MMTTNDYLDAVARKFSRENGAPASDYKLADLLRVRVQTIYRYRKEQNRFDEDVAIRVAELLGIDPAIVLLDTAAERTKCPEAREVWERLSKRVAGGVFAIFLSVLVGFFAPVRDAEASMAATQAAVTYNDEGIYIIRSAIRRLRAWLRGLFWTAGIQMARAW